MNDVSVLLTIIGLLSGLGSGVIKYLLDENEKLKRKVEALREEVQTLEDEKYKMRDIVSSLAWKMSDPAKTNIQVAREILDELDSLKKGRSQT